MELMLFQALAININDLNENPFFLQLGSDIDAEAAGDKFGYGLDINENGTIIAVGEEEMMAGELIQDM